MYLEHKYIKTTSAPKFRSKLLLCMYLEHYKYIKTTSAPKFRSIIKQFIIMHNYNYTPLWGLYHSNWMGFNYNKLHIPHN